MLPLGSKGLEYGKTGPNDDSSPRIPAPVFGKKSGIQCDSGFRKPIRSGLNRQKNKNPVYFRAFEQKIYCGGPLAGGLAWVWKIWLGYSHSGEFGYSRIPGNSEFEWNDNSMEFRGIQNSRIVIPGIPDNHSTLFDRGRYAYLGDLIFGI